ncbi:hypothetical protein KAR26_00820 [Candidatus Parcubacteria bacterium]|nr:hypothetical protein [Candidatus Parcubacteria bacterium]
MLLFAFTTFIAHKKGGVWAKNEGEGIGGLLMKSFILWIYLAGFVGIIISYTAIKGNPAFFITLGEKLETMTASFISLLSLPF